MTPSRRTVPHSASVVALSIAAAGCCQMFPSLCDFGGDIRKIATAASKQATTILTEVEKLFPNGLPTNVRTAVTDFIKAASDIIQISNAIWPPNAPGSTKQPSNNDINTIITSIFLFLNALDSLADAVGQLVPALGPVLTTAAEALGLALSVAQGIAEVFGYKPPPPTPPAPPPPPPGGFLPGLPPSPPRSSVYLNEGLTAAKTPPEQARQLLPP
jgi:hypothetical protein